MLAIYFFCAGHGDAITLEWEDQGEKKFGIIDCNKNGNLNPTKYFFQAFEDPKIEFCILSHPHWDHYSGYLEFLDFCSDRKILPTKFYHTAEFHKSVLYGSVMPQSKRAILANLFSKIHKLTLDHSIEFSGEFAFDNSKEIKLNNNLFIDFLGPAYSDFSKYKRKCLRYNLASKKANYINNSDANILSTVLQINFRKKPHLESDWSLLLTSDAEKKILERILKKNKKKLSSNITICQIPHHGSKHNHSRKFWASFNKEDQCPAVVCAGQNDHGHPDKDVIKDFSIMKYNPICNNNIGTKKVSVSSAFSYSPIEQILKLPEVSTNLKYPIPKETDIAGLKITIDKFGNASQPEYRSWAEIRNL